MKLNPFGIDESVEIPRANIGILPAPPAAAAMQWAKHASDAFNQVRASTAAVKKAAQEAAKWAAVAKVPPHRDIMRVV